MYQCLSLIGTIQIAKWISLFLCAKWGDKYEVVSMCIPEIEPKLKGIFTFQTQASFHLSLYLEEGRLELGDGIQSAVLFLREMSCFAPSLWEADKKW